MSTREAERLKSVHIWDTGAHLIPRSKHLIPWPLSTGHGGPICMARLTLKIGAMSPAGHPTAAVSHVSGRAIAGCSLRLDHHNHLAHSPWCASPPSSAPPPPSSLRPRQPLSVTPPLSSLGRLLRKHQHPGEHPHLSRRVIDSPLTADVIQQRGPQRGFLRGHNRCHCR